MDLTSFVEIVPWILGWGEHARAVAPKVKNHRIDRG
jgi:hypothetical protein